MNGFKKGLTKNIERNKLLLHLRLYTSKKREGNTGHNLLKKTTGSMIEMAQKISRQEDLHFRRCVEEEGTPFSAWMGGK